MPEIYEKATNSEQYIRRVLADKFEMTRPNLTGDELIASLVENIGSRHDHGVEVVSIIGGAASGKSTLARALIDELATAGLTSHSVSTDDFVKGDRAWRWEHFEGKVNADPIGKYDFAMLNEKIQAIRQIADEAQSVAIPTYNQETGLAIDEGEQNYQHKVGKVDVLIIEGDFNAVEDSDLVIYLHVADDQRLQNRVNRDVAQRGGDSEKTTKSFIYRQRTQHLPHTLPSVMRADVVIDVSTEDNSWLYNVYTPKS